MSEGHYNVLYTKEAESDIEQIFSYISYNLQSPFSTQNVVIRIQNVINSLNFLPTRFKIVEWQPWKSKEIHQVSVGDYCVFYKVDGENNSVYIYRVFYGKRDIQALAMQEENNEQTK